jgi:hypothetical protein
MAHFPGDKFKIMKKVGDPGVYYILQAVVSFHRNDPHLNLTIGYWDTQEKFLDLEAPAMSFDSSYSADDIDLKNLRAACRKILKREFVMFTGAVDEELVVPEPRCFHCDNTFDICVCNECVGCHVDIDECECEVHDTPFNIATKEL